MLAGQSLNVTFVLESAGPNSHPAPITPSHTSGVHQTFGGVHIGKIKYGYGGSAETYQALSASHSVTALNADGYHGMSLVLSAS